MADEPVTGSQAYTVGLYQTRITLVTAEVSNFGLILPADSRRWAVRFQVDPLLGIGLVLIPGPVPDGFSPTIAVREAIEVKFRDAPSWCCGEWYAKDPAGSQIIIWECLYVRG